MSPSCHFRHVWHSQNAILQIPIYHGFPKSHCLNTTLRQSWRRTKLEPRNRQTRTLFTTPAKTAKSKMAISNSTLIGGFTLVMMGAITYSLYQNDHIQPLPPNRLRSDIRADRLEGQAGKQEERIADGNAGEPRNSTVSKDVEHPDCESDHSAWASFTKKFDDFSSATGAKFTSVGEQITDYILPDWATYILGYISKLQRELSMAPGSLADEIWTEAHDPYINPEIKLSASVRVSSELCDDEKYFLRKRKQVIRTALAKYLDIPEEDVHPDDVPTIAMVGSGGGLRALVAGTGSMLAAREAGLFDCVTFTAGVSGSCWLQALYHSSLGGRRFDKLVDHLKARIGIHIAYPPVALAALNSAPTNKFLLSGFVEKLKGDPNADFGIVDVYGLLLAARLLVPKGEVGVEDRDLKISNQREYIKHGEQPMPIYTAVRHEIPTEEETLEGVKISDAPSEETKEKAKKEAWFQWFEITPYEMFCEEFAAGIPTWSIGRKFEAGKDVPQDGIHVPEMRLPLLLGLWGSAFCASLSHYYKEVRPLVKGLIGFGGIDEMIEGRNEDLSKVHPIDPATICNFAYKMEGRLPETTPECVYKDPHLQLMDAGVSNNLPIYPLLRPGRDVEILIAFDASADIKQENWLSVADGYAKQRGIKGWPIGLGWPNPTDPVGKTAGELDEAQASTAAEAETKVKDAKADQQAQVKDVKEPAKGTAENKDAAKDPDDLGYYNVWVGTTEERSSSSDDPPSKAVEEDWQLKSPSAGIAVAYFPFLSNPKVEGVDPEKSEYMSTWNFVYTPEEVDKVVALARANYGEGAERMKATVRAVYERKKRKREEKERRQREERWRRKVRLGIVGKMW